MKYIINNGHTIQVNFENAGGATFKEQKYTLTQLHFHAPSETHIQGKSFPMEIYLVHKNDMDTLLVIAVLMKEGYQNKALNDIVAHMPYEVGEPEKFKNINVSHLLPSTYGYYAFSGNFTTPPCSENVQWIVLKTPVEASKKQIDSLQAVMKNNARKVQPLYNRAVYITS